LIGFDPARVEKVVDGKLALAPASFLDFTTEDAALADRKNEKSGR